MRIFVLWSLFFVLSPAARADDAALPVYLPERIQKALLTGLFERKAFTFERAPATECTRKDLDRMTVFRCKVSVGQLQFDGAGNGSEQATPSLHFTGLTVFYNSLSVTPAKMLREYIFSGTWTETIAGVSRSTALRWTIHRWGDDATFYHGFLELPDWGSSARLVANVP